MNVECIKISSWELTRVNDKLCMTRKVGNKIEVRNLTFWERLRNALHNVGGKK